MLGFLLIAASPLFAQLPHSIDIGAPSHKGSSRFDNGVYRITASGQNMWGATDEFHM
ncbi:MAG: hypothetical protein JNL62_20295, partial [Bryobacterales bacterium]|nr:hypothetical protein [Bryobacterales bacterium]